MKGHISTHREREREREREEDYFACLHPLRLVQEGLLFSFRGTC